MKKVIVKTIKNKECFINEYINDWKNKILLNSTMRYGDGLFCINTFVLNPYILETISMKEIEVLTSKLLKLFPVDKNKEFNEFMNRCQFHSSDHCIETLGGFSYELFLNTNYPSLLNISDYSICEIGGYVFVFHLDLNYGLGITISSIFRKDDFNLIKPFDRKITLKEVS